MDSMSMNVLFERVLNKERHRFSVNEFQFRTALQNVKEAYLPNKDWPGKMTVLYADYNDPAHRCAYLHKYAMCHTGMVQDLLWDAAFKLGAILRRQLRWKLRLNLCSLGGGPGTDVVAILDLLTAFFDFFPCFVSIVDLTEGWKGVFESTLQELRNGPNWRLRDILSPFYFHYNYITANLLQPLRPSVKRYLKDADFISMVKFISAAACADTRAMIAEIFSCMKPGAIVIFIDNAAGGFLQVLQEQAESHGLLTVHGPVEHYCHENFFYYVDRFGCPSQWKTLVSFQMWIKPHSYNPDQLLQKKLLPVRADVKCSKIEA
ncbi:uncharacterized protein LOC129216892 [Uloborus diversus]|uniref:uncharacterized protein LOC129216892 n=1 Tax=Uloborus diversus TaxID=327109 RepID=UPI00240982AF|nr:uncharacterized protein LOC129216892 [Uloborus diversus]